LAGFVAAAFLDVGTSSLPWTGTAARRAASICASSKPHCGSGAGATGGGAISVAEKASSSADSSQTERAGGFGAGSVGVHAGSFSAGISIVALSSSGAQ
jgi:hypothetical protein